LVHAACQRQRAAGVLVQSKDGSEDMSESFSKGDKVSWNASQGRTKGRVERKQTSETKIKGHKVAASKDDPQYIVKSAESGELAAHKPDALHKID
jgi:hypothetical protein